ncbi:N-formylglutamate deformylase [Burkholderiales bacterium]|nr:N-formylglutamate deformylase [Burkholderiales bacterium]
MNLWTLHRGESPLLVDVPHAGTHVPDAIAMRLTEAGRTLPDTDWHVEKLYAFARDAGATLMAATHSRYVVDLNRDPAGVALYAGADNTELVPTRTFDNAPIWREGGVPDPGEVAARTQAYFTPYHDAFADEVERVRLRHGFAIVLDGHSIRAEVPRFFAGRLPDFNLGTADGASADSAIERLAAGIVAEDSAFTSVVNGRFRGGWITRRYGRPRAGVHALQLEVAQAAYMDEAPPYRWDARRAAPLEAVLRRLVAALVAWRPGRAS